MTLYVHIACPSKSVLVLSVILCTLFLIVQLLNFKMWFISHASPLIVCLCNLFVLELLIVELNTCWNVFLGKLIYTTGSFREAFR